MTWLHELRDRKLVQWLLAYLAAAWVLAQVADLVGSKFGWPDAWMRSLIVVLAIGAFAVLVLAWFHGEKGAQRVGALEGGLLAGLVILAVAGVLWVRASDADAGAPGAAAVAGEATIAVLPFVNLSDSEENEHFSDGITEDVLSALGRSHRLRVISRTSVMQYKGTAKPLKQIAAELGVKNILEGSVRRAGNKVRVTAQLIDARTDEHLWAQNYDRDLSDIFAIQTDIAEQIAAALHAALSPEERAVVVAGRTDDVEAYDLYLRARTVAHTARDLPGMEQAAALFHDALAVDSTYALAYAGLAEVYAQKRFSAGPAWQDSAYGAARKALALEPQLAEAHATLGDLHWYFSRYDEALGAYRMAIRLDPNNSQALRGMAFALSWQNDLEDAFRWSLRAGVVDPADYTASTLTASIYHKVDDFENAERWYRASLAKQEHVWATSALASLYLQHQQADRAAQVLEEFDAVISADGTVWLRAQIALARGQYAAATQLFEQADSISRASLAEDVKGPPPLQLAYLYLRAGERARAEGVLREVEAAARGELSTDETGSARLQLVGVCALRRQTDCALEHINTWADGKTYRASIVVHNPLYENVRGEPAFQRAVARVEARAAALRQRMAVIAREAGG